jgi:hypothetical protein
MFGLGINKLGTPRDQALPEPETLLFANDEEGTFLDFTTTQVYADTAGTDPAEVGEGIALTLDKSQGGPGPELVTNGDGSSTVGWSAFVVGAGVPDNSKLSSSGDEFIIDASLGNTVAEQGLTTVVGRSYRAVIDVTALGAGNRYWIQLSNVSLSNGTVIFGPLNAAQSFSFLFVATATTTYFQVHADNLGVPTVNFDNVSVREIPGTHSTQATSAARPIFGRVPVGGRRNLLTFSEDGISKYTSVSNVVDGSLPGFDTALVYGDNSVTRAAYKLTSVVGGQEYTSSAYIQMDDGGAPTTADFNFFSSGGLPVPTITLVSGSLYRVSSSRVPPSTSNTVSGFQKTTGQSARTFKTSGIMHELGSTPTPYQKVVTQHDITEAGIPSIYKAFFDKADDILPVTLPTITGGTVALVGTSGIWIEEDWGFTAGTLSIGPTTIAGLPAGILSVVGDLCAVIINDRAWTAAEYAGVVSWGKARGAPGVFAVSDTELVTNGTFDDGTTDWAIDAARGTISWQPGVLRVTNDQATGYPSAYQALTGLTVGKVYSLSAVVRGTDARLRITSTSLDVYSPSNITSASFVADAATFVATATSATAYLYCNQAGNTGDYAEFDNISVRKLEIIS